MEKMEVKTEDLLILVVDDEQDTRDACERILTKMGYPVLTAEGGSKALKLIEANPVSIVLLDLKMPGVDGIDILRQVDESILVVVITGYATIETAIEAMKLGAYDFLPKPFEPDGLRIVVKRAMEKIRLSRETTQLKTKQQEVLNDLGIEKKRTRTILESLPAGIFVTNREGKVVLVNPACCRLLNLEQDAVLGESLDDFITDNELWDLVRKVSKGRIKEEQVLPPLEFSVSEEQHLLARGQTILTDQGESLGAVITLEDIGWFVALNNIKSEFVAEVSHELRSPLSTIHEQLALVIRDLNRGDISEDLPILSRALEKTHDLISLVGDLLDLSRIDSGISFAQTEAIDLDDFLTKIIQFLTTRAENKKQTLTLTAEGEATHKVRADPLAIESIFGNLITNAINYTPEGGAIEVKMETNEKMVVVAVCDNGLGIPEDLQEMIFKKFYRVKNEKTRGISGTGLGLPIVKGLIDTVGGTIELESQEGKGSIFTVALPKI
jgi:PAS domain S-box-containing protein